MKTALAIAVLSLALGAQSDTLSYPWIYSAESYRIHTAPSHQWLDDGTLILGEESAEGLAKGLRRLNPDTGVIAPFFDLRGAARAIAKLDPAAARRAAFPDEIDRQGSHALYQLDGDLWLVTTKETRAIRVTRTEAEEKSARFSPNGLRLAYVRDNDLYVYEIQSGLERRITTDGSKTILNGTLSWVYWEEIFGRQDLGYWWSEDSTALAFLRTDESPVGVALFLDHRGKYPELIEQRYPKTGTKNPIVTVGIAELSADDTKTHWIDFGDHAFEYIGRVKWLPDSSEVAVSTLNRAQNRLDLFFATRQDGKARRILVEEDEAWINLHDDLWFLRHGEQFLWVSERTGHAHVYRYAKDGKLLGAVTKGDWSVRDSGAVFWLRKAIKAVDEASGLVFFNALEKSSIENHVYSVSIDGGEITRLTREDGTHTASFRGDGKYWTDEHSTARTPPSVTLHQGDGSLVVVIAPPRTDLLDDLDVVFPEFLEVPATDGFKMPAYLYRPADFDPEKRYPVIVYGYGGPSAPSVSDSWQGPDFFHNNILVREGFIVACIDNRSATAIAKKYENSILGQMYGDSE
ncbi:MAG: DPP IV N-terminal domain-containing protein, partial [Salinibacterium sp.]|nr:DPP IV N-terminal domain-containing protein [Salinibacterium sp.]